MPFHSSAEHGLVKSDVIDQVCAVPFRQVGEKIEFCVITSSAGRWKFPKGFVESEQSLEETAMQEAHEEAGLHGNVVGDILGYYDITKDDSTLTVAAVLMEVSESDADWQESDSRQRRWVTSETAHDLITEADLHDLLDAAINRLQSNGSAGPGC